MYVCLFKHVLYILYGFAAEKKNVIFVWGVSGTQSARFEAPVKFNM